MKTYDSFKGELADAALLPWRQTLYFTALKNRLPEIAAERVLSPDTPDVIRDDVVYDLAERLESMLLGTDSRAQWIIPENLDSVLAWLCDQLKTQARYAVADAAGARAEVAVAHIESLGNILTVGKDASDGAEDDAQRLDLEALQASLHRAHGIGRVRIQAQLLRKHYQLTPLGRPRLRRVRDLLLHEIELEPSLPRTSLENFLDHRNPASPMMAVWEALPEDELFTLQELEDRVLTVLVRDALLPRSRPGRDALRAHRVALKSLSSKRGWPTAASRLQEAWLGEFYAASADFGKPRSTTPDAQAATWEDACDAARAFPGSPVSHLTNQGIDDLLVSML